MIPVGRALLAAMIVLGVVYTVFLARLQREVPLVGGYIMHHFSSSQIAIETPSGFIVLTGDIEEIGSAEHLIVGRAKSDWPGLRD